MPALDDVYASEMRCVGEKYRRSVRIYTIGRLFNAQYSELWLSRAKRALGTKVGCATN